MNLTNTVNYINSLYQQDGSFKYSLVNPISNLYSTTFGVLAMDLTGQLEKLSPEMKTKTTEYILSRQNQEGYFTDYSEADYATKFSGSHSYEYVLLQQTDFSLMALRALGVKQYKSLTFLQKYKNNEYLDRWLHGLNWKNPWYISNLVMFILNMFIYEQEDFGVDNYQYIKFIMSWLNKFQDKQNGLWNLGKQSTYIQQMAGAFHFIIFHTYLNMQIPYVEKMVDSTLKIQNYDHLFSYKGGGGACEDLDAIDILVRSRFYTDYKAAEVKSALLKAYHKVILDQNNDGGFSWARIDRLDLRNLAFAINPILLFKVSPKDFLVNAKQKLETFYKVKIKHNFVPRGYSGLTEMKVNTHESELWSTWFRLLAISFIEYTYPTEATKSGMKWNHKQSSGLGFITHFKQDR